MALSRDAHAVHLLAMRAKGLAVLVAVLGFMTLVSFWAVYYWPLLLVIVLLVVSVHSFRIATSGLAFRSYSSIFLGRELMLVLFALAHLLCFGEAVCGVILAILSDDPLRTVFQVVSSVTGVISLVVLFFLQATLRYLNSPALAPAGVISAVGPPPDSISYPGMVRSAVVHDPLAHGDVRSHFPYYDERSRSRSPRGSVVLAAQRRSPTRSVIASELTPSPSFRTPAPQTVVPVEGIEEMRWEAAYTSGRGTASSFSHLPFDTSRSALRPVAPPPTQEYRYHLPHENQPSFRASLYPERR